jgi:NitT/TauT family transport system ATP-binding protein
MMLQAVKAVNPQITGDRQPLIKAAHLMKDFPGAEGGRLRILNDINFEIKAGEFIVLTGQSGCGKTTLLRILMGLSTPSSGSLTVGGKEVHGCDRKRTMVFQNSELLPWRSALRNVELGLETAGVPAVERHKTARHYLQLVGLEGAESRRPDQLSGGMRQRVGLARALAVDPDVMLMDEPFGALDAHTREALQNELLRLHEQLKKTIIFVTHDLEEAVLLADRVIVLSPAGTLGEIIDVDLPRPRSDPALLRSTQPFNDLRYRIWKSMKQMEGMTRPGQARSGK